MDNSSIKVLQLIDALSAGGAEMMAVNIANALQEEGFTSHICTTRLEGVLKNKLDERVGYLFLAKKNTFDLMAIWKLKKYIRKHKIQIVHAHSNSFFIAVMVKIFFQPKLKIIWHNHTGSNIHLRGLKLRVLKCFSIFFRASINVNLDLKNWSLQNFHGKNHFYLQNFAHFSDEKNTILKGMNGKRIVCVAGYRIEKNHINLLNAFAQINIDYPDWTLHLIGKGYDDPYHKKINNTIEKFQLNQVVFQYGVRTDIGHILSQSEIGILSSDSEGLPVSLLEYGLAGLAVVVTEVGQCPEVVLHGKLGKTVPPGKSDLLAEKISFLIENENERKLLGNQLKQHIFDNYSKEAFVKKLTDIYLI